MARFTDEKIGAIREMVESGLMSYGEIGQKLRVSRSVIAGICFRNGIRAPAGRRPPPRPRARSAAKPPVIRAAGHLCAPVAVKLPPSTPPSTPAPAPESKPCSILDLETDSCRWPLWGVHEKGGKYCGAHAVPGSSYCAHHLAISRGAGTISERTAVDAAKRMMRTG
jgi:GcrA cell cycle regulator